MLVSYGSSSGSEAGGSPAPEAHPAAAPLEHREEEDEDDFDPADAFGIARLPKGQSSTGAKVAVVASEAVAAPDVMINVSGTHLPVRESTDRVEPQDPSISTAGSTSLITRASDSIVFFNPSYQDMSRPSEGPANPWNERRLEKQNTLTGQSSSGARVRRPY